MKKHKHAEVIHAYAEGAKIQYKNSLSEWSDTENPAFCDEYEYRIKPEPKKYRVALFDGYTTTQDSTECSYGVKEGFVKWLTDWVEYEE